MTNARVRAILIGHWAFSVRGEGFEPSRPASKTGGLPLADPRERNQKSEGRRKYRCPHFCLLPSAFCLPSAPAEGIEPSSFGLTDPRLTIRHHRKSKSVSKWGLAPSNQPLISDRCSS